MANNKTKRYKVIMELNMDSNNTRKLIINAKSQDHAKRVAESIVKKDPNVVYFKVNSCDEIPNTNTSMFVDES